MIKMFDMNDSNSNGVGKQVMELVIKVSNHVTTRNAVPALKRCHYFVLFSLLNCLELVNR